MGRGQAAGAKTDASRGVDITSHLLMADGGDEEGPVLPTFFDTLTDALTCPICHELLEGAVELPCSHAFCSECIRRSLCQGRRECPQCRKEATGGDIKKSPVLQDAVKGLREAMQGWREWVADEGGGGNGSRDELRGSGKKKEEEEKKGVEEVEVVVLDDDGDDDDGIEIIEDEVSIDSDADFVPDSEDESPQTPKAKRRKGVQGSSVNGTIPRVLAAGTKRGATQKETSQRNGDLVECPICGSIMRNCLMNIHLDTCLGKQETQAAKNACPRVDTTREEGQNKPSSSKRTKPPSFGTTKVSPSVQKKPSSEQAKPSSSEHVKPVKSSETEHKRLPKLAFEMMNDKKVREKAQQYGLNISCGRDDIIWKIQEFTIRYNASLDSVPKKFENVVREVEKEHQSIQRQQFNSTRVNEEESKKIFLQLIAEIRQRPRAQRPRAQRPEAQREEEENETVIDSRNPEPTIDGSLKKKTIIGIGILDELTPEELEEYEAFQGFEGSAG